MGSIVVGTAAAGRKAGLNAIFAAAALCSLAGCVSNDRKSIETSELGDPVAVTVAATGTDESGQQVALKVPLPGERPANVAVASLEATPTDAPDDGKDARVAAIALAPSEKIKGTISGSSAIDRMIEQAADENGVPRELAFAVVHVESRYNPKAKGAGVYGLSQIMPSTARSLGFSGPADALFDPATNLRYGMKYLKGAWEKGGRDICQASMKYKGGHRATTMTKSAATYCSNVKRHMASITGRSVADVVQIASLAAQTAVPSAAPRILAAAATAMAPDPSLPGVSATRAIHAKVGTARDAAPAVVPIPVTQQDDAEPSDAPVVTAAFADPTAEPEPDPSRFGE